MFVKVYRYRIQSDKTQEFLLIQERASRIYRKHVSYRAVYLQSQDDPSLWLEIQWCDDEETYRRAMEVINSEPEIKELWKEFQSLLDPNDPVVQEERFEQVRADGV